MHCVLCWNRIGRWLQSTKPGPKLQALVLAVCGSFRGPEVFLTELYRLIKYGSECLVAAAKEYVMIPLLGCFKNEVGDQYHLTPLVAMSKSGLQVKTWANRLIEVRKSGHQLRGPAFADVRTGEVRVDWFEREILDHFQSVQQRRPDVIPADVQVLEEYGMSRSFRRVATSEVRARGTDKDDTDLANRWRTFKGAKGKRAPDGYERPLFGHTSANTCAHLVFRKYVEVVEF